MPIRYGRDRAGINLSSRFATVLLLFCYTTFTVRLMSEAGAKSPRIVRELDRGRIF